MLRFTKMQGLGNDYVYLDCTGFEPEGLEELAIRVANRNFGIGSDGLICICKSDRADFRMRMFNADGSEGEMCGNGIRCVGKFVYDKGLTTKTELKIETLAGIKSLKFAAENGKVQEVTVDMGRATVEDQIEVSVKGNNYTGVPVSMGNPHFVVFQETIDTLDLAGIGPEFERLEYFPNRTNTEFIEMEAPGILRMRVWERGSGETMACGTGACAAAAAAYASGLTGSRVTVRLRGGELTIRIDEQNGHIYMTGPAVTVFEGEFF